MKRLVLVLATCLAGLGGLAGCNVNPYDLVTGGGSGTDAGTTGDGKLAIDASGDGGGGIDAAPPDACLPSPEVCNNKDDDCDGVVDNGFNKMSDPNNCGTCGNACTYNNQFGVCNSGTCAPGDCKPGYHDLMHNPPTDCSYFCIATNGGVEVCDNIDNDCDGVVDNGFNTQTDINNCGSCGHICNILNATPTCASGVCQIQQCNPGYVDANNDPTDGCEYQCTKTNGGVEICDGIDNDCNGQVDDGNPGGGASCGSNVGACVAGTTTCSFGVLFCVGATGPSTEQCNMIDDDCDGQVDEDWNFASDPANCGSCGHICAFPNAAASCTMSACTLGACNANFYNINGNPADGCEYECTKTGAETCDNIDNDCDGVIDNGFNKQTDVNNCGTCGHVCSFTNASATCVSGGCQLGTCNANFYNIDGNPANGCEYGCVKTNGGVEKCDGLDNDCNGIIDDGNPGGGTSCGTNTGACTAGTTACVAGQVVCQGSVGPSVETCNNIDDDCNGVVDNGFDKLNDPRYCMNCAGCGTLPNAVAGCAAGACTVAGCLQGWVDANGVVADGCEYQCTKTGPEVCDGLDNDCDGQIDEAGALTQPPNFCKTAGACAGTTPSCQGAAGWKCVYTSPDVELDGSGNLVLEETRCDGKDNDCDGGVDETYPLKGTACAEDGTFGTTRKLGACRGTGSLVCNSTKNGLACNVTVAGATPVSETCNNKDDDCDGHIDEPYDASGFTGVRDATVGPVTVNGKSVVMYKYEASRPDATSAAMGIVQTRSCSTVSKMPWASPDLAHAQAACAAAGMRLCKVTRDAGGNITSDEWGRFCASSSPRIWPYGNTFNGTACNGSAYDPIPATPANEDQAIATGTLATCTSVDTALDMSGNLKEWTDDARTAAGQTVYTLRGGSFDNNDSQNSTAHALGCGFDLTVVPTNYTFANTGFRCCSLACPAGQVECNGVCKDLAADSNNCGACGNVCGGGGACFNGYCCPAGTMLCPGTDQCKASCP